MSSNRKESRKSQRDGQGQKRDDAHVKESRILGILHWRRTCKRLLEVLRELQQIKQSVGQSALDVCDQALKQFRANNVESRRIERLRKKVTKDKAIPPER